MQVLNAMSVPERIALISKAVLWATSEVGLDGLAIEKVAFVMSYYRLVLTDQPASSPIPSSHATRRYRTLEC